MSIYIIIVTAYFLFVMLVSVFTRKLATKTSADFLIAGRNLGVVTCAVVVAAEWLGGMSTIGVSEKAFKIGTLQPMLYNLATATGMIIIGFTVAYHYRKNQVYTVSEMLEYLFGRDVRTISAIAFLIAYITLSYVQLQTFAGVVSRLFDINWFWGVIIASVIITFYTYMGGMHAIAITGIIHVVTMFIGLGLAFFIGLHRVGGFSNLQQLLVSTGSPHDFYNPFSTNLSYAFSLLLGGVLGGMAGQASIQPVFAAKTPSVAKKAAILSSLIIAPFGLMTAFLGLMARTGLFFDPSTIENTKQVLPKLLMSPSFVSPFIGGIAIAGIMAAILSTVGPVNFAIVTITIRDIYHNLLKRDADDTMLLKSSRRLVILINIITIPLAVMIKGAILDSAYVYYAIRAIGAIVIIAGIYLKPWTSKLGVKMAFIGGTIVIFICVIANRMGWFHIDKTYGSVASAIFFLFLGYVIDSIRGVRANQA